MQCCRTSGRQTPREPQKVQDECRKKADAADAAAGKRDALKKELTAKKLTHAGTGPFQVSLESGSAQEIIKAVDTPLTLLEIHQPSLEDAYIDIIGGQHAQ